MGQYCYLRGEERSCASRYLLANLWTVSAQTFFALKCLVDSKFMIFDIFFSTPLKNHTQQGFFCRFKQCDFPPGYDKHEMARLDFVDHLNPLL